MKYFDYEKQLSFNQFYERLRHNNRYLAIDIINDKRKRYIRPSSNLTHEELEALDKIILNNIIRLKGIREIYSETHRHSSYIFNLKTRYNLTNPHRNFTWNVKNKLEKNYDYPITPLAQKIMNGTLLGDGSIALPNYSKGKPVIDIKNYQEAINTIKSLKKKPNELNWNFLIEDIKKFRKASNLISHAPTAKLTIHKDQLEKKWLDIIQSILSSEQIPAKVSLCKGDSIRKRYIRKVVHEA